MKKVINAYKEAIASIQKLMDEVENAKVKLEYEHSDEEPTSIDVVIRGSLESSPFYHPSIDDIVDEVMDLSGNLEKCPSKHFDPIPVTPNNAYKMILSYFENNPILMKHVSGVIRHVGEYHTCHWKDMCDKIMDYRGISDPTKVRLTEHVLETGEIKIDTDNMLKCYFGEYDTVLKLINETRKVGDC